MHWSYPKVCVCVCIPHVCVCAWCVCVPLTPRPFPPHGDWSCNMLSILYTLPFHDNILAFLTTFMPLCACTVSVVSEALVSFRGTVKHVVLWAQWGQTVHYFTF